MKDVQLPEFRDPDLDELDVAVLLSPRGDFAHDEQRTRHEERTPIDAKPAPDVAAHNVVASGEQKASSPPRVPMGPPNRRATDGESPKPVKRPNPPRSLGPPPPSGAPCAVTYQGRDTGPLLVALASALVALGAGLVVVVAIMWSNHSGDRALGQTNVATSQGNTNGQPAPSPEPAKRTTDATNATGQRRTNGLIEAAIPPEWENHYRRGRTYFEQSDWNKAVGDLQTAVSLNPDNADAKRLLAEAYCRRALDHANHDPDFAADVQGQDNALRDYRRAAQQSEEVAGFYADQFAVICYLRAAKYRTSGLTEAALEQLNTAISLRPDSAPAYMARSYIYHKQGNRRDADEDLKRALRYGYDDWMSASCWKDWLAR